MEDILRIDETTAKQKISIILSLAIPAMVENILQTLVGFVDTMFVSRLGILDVTAVGVTNTLLAVYIAIFMALSVGTSSMIARSVGAGDLERAKGIAQRSTCITTIVGLILGMVTLFFAAPLLKVMGAEPQVLADATIYFRIVAVPSIFIAFMYTFGSILRATGDTKTPMKVTMWINLLHILADYVLIFGLWKFTGLGIAGAAWATVLVRVVGTIALFKKIRHSKVAFGLVARSEKAITSQLITLSTPTAIERLVMRLGQVLYFGLIVRISTETFAAHTIAGNIEQFAYMPGYGLAIAATTLVGQSIGAKKEKDAYSFGMLTTVVGIVVMTFGGVVFLFILSPWLATWFTHEANVTHMVVTALRIDTFAQPFLAVSLVLAGVLQGIGDTKSPMYSTAVGMWVIRIVGVYIMSIKFGLGIAGVWLSIAIDLFARAIFLFFRFKRVFRM